MKTYFADANIFLRFILKDDKKLARKSRYYFTQAKNGEIVIVVLSEVILEIEYVLRKVYLISREDIALQLSNLINTSYFKINERILYRNVIKIYKDKTVDLTDAFLFLKAQEKNAEVLSFDKDFRKLKKFDKYISW